MINKIYNEDNYELLNKLIENGYRDKIDLVYIDPPFATGRIFTMTNERVSTISPASNGQTAYSDKYSLDEYLFFLKTRVEIIHELLSNKGSFYLHIDYKIGHYVKVMLDSIFGIENFRSDITRIKCNPKNFSRKNYGNIKDMILFYTKTDDYIFNNIKVSSSSCDIQNRFSKIDLNGKRYTTVPLHAPGETSNGSTSEMFRGQYPPKGRHWRYTIDVLEKLYNDGLIETSSSGNMRLKNYADDYADKKLQDIWEFKDPQNISYPTQKNSEMLDYIVLNSSKENSIVMDCFCGSGSFLV